MTVCNTLCEMFPTVDLCGTHMQLVRQFSLPWFIVTLVKIYITKHIYPPITLREHQG